MVVRIAACGNCNRSSMFVFTGNAVLEPIWSWPSACFGNDALGAHRWHTITVVVDIVRQLSGLCANNRYDDIQNAQAAEV